MKLNIGCGFLKLDGYTNVDNQALCNPDMCFDLEQPWPLPTSSVREIVAHHVLEHLGETTHKFISLLKEMYRVSEPNALWIVNVPHWHHDNFYHDATHVRVITPVTLDMFNQQRNVDDFNANGHETKLGLFSEIDIEVINSEFMMSPRWERRIQQKKLSMNDMEDVLQDNNNVCCEIKMIIKIHKPQRFATWTPAIP